MAKKEKSSLVLPYDFEAVFDYLSVEQAGRLIRAIYAFERRDEEPDFSDDALLDITWKTNVRIKVEHNKRKYQEVVEARREAGKQGGRPKNEENQNKPKKANGFSENQNKPKKADNDCDCDCDCEGDKGKAAARAREQTPFPVVVNDKEDVVREAVRFYTDHINSALYADGIGKVKLLLSQYGMAEFKRAVTLMAKRGGRSLNYLEKILQDPHEDTGQLEEATIRAVLK